MFIFSLLYLFSFHVSQPGTSSYRRHCKQGYFLSMRAVKANCRIALRNGTSSYWRYCKQGFFLSNRAVKAKYRIALREPSFLHSLLYLLSPYVSRTRASLHWYCEQGSLIVQRDAILSYRIVFNQGGVLYLIKVLLGNRIMVPQV